MLKNMAHQGQKELNYLLSKGGKRCKANPPCPPPTIASVGNVIHPTMAQNQRYKKKRHRQYWGAENIHFLGRSNTRTPHQCFGLHLDICFLDHSNGIHHIYSTHHASARYSSPFQGCSLSLQSLACSSLTLAHNVLHKSTAALLLGGFPSHYDPPRDFPVQS